MSEFEFHWKINLSNETQKKTTLKVAGHDVSLILSVTLIYEHTECSSLMNTVSYYVRLAIVCINTRHLVLVTSWKSLLIFRIITHDIHIPLRHDM